MSNLVLWQPLDPLLGAYCSSTALSARRARSRLRQKIESVLAINRPLIAELEPLIDKINRVKYRIRLLQKGAPATDSLDAYSAADAVSNGSDADRFLLKKAYRAAATVAHPDKGGTTEEFQSVYDAYLARDIHALNNYVLAKQAPTLELIQHWLDDIARCDVAWVEFRTTVEFEAASLVQQGHTEMALALLRDRLMQALKMARQAELQFLCPRLFEGEPL